MSIRNEKRLNLGWAAAIVTAAGVMGGMTGCENPNRSARYNDGDDTGVYASSARVETVRAEQGMYSEGQPCRTAWREPSWSETRWADDNGAFQTIYTGNNYNQTTFKTRSVSPSVDCVSAGSWSEGKSSGDCGCAGKNKASATQMDRSNTTSQPGERTRDNRINMNGNMAPASGSTNVQSERSSSEAANNNANYRTYNNGKYGDARDQYHEVTVAEIQSRQPEAQTASRNTNQ